MMAMMSGLMRYVGLLRPLSRLRLLFIVMRTAMMMIEHLPPISGGMLGLMYSASMPAASTSRSGRKALMMYTIGARTTCERAARERQDARGCALRSRCVHAPKTPLTGRHLAARSGSQGVDLMPPHIWSLRTST